MNLPTVWPSCRLAADTFRLLLVQHGLIAAQIVDVGLVEEVVVVSIGSVEQTIVPLLRHQRLCAANRLPRDGNVGSSLPVSIPSISIGFPNVQYVKEPPKPLRSEASFAVGTPNHPTNSLGGYPISVVALYQDELSVAAPSAWAVA